MQTLTTKRSTTKLGLGRLLVAAAALLGASTASAQLIPSVVPAVDLESYAGHWYEVASTQPFFQANCVCVTADYTLRDDGKVGVVNTCRQGGLNGEDSTVEGTATATKNPAKLKVQFGPIPAPVSNYWVVDLADDYSYAVVSTVLRTPIWILSRTPSLPSDTLTAVYERLAKNGYRVSAIKPTLQDGCGN